MIVEEYWKICMTLFLGFHAVESLNFIAARLSELEHPDYARLMNMQNQWQLPFG